MSSPSSLTNAAEERFWLGVDAHGIPSAIIGTMALNEFGHPGGIVGA